MEGLPTSEEISDKVDSKSFKGFLQSQFPHASNLVSLAFSLGISQAWEYDKMITNARSTINNSNGYSKSNLNRFHHPMYARPYIRFNKENKRNEVTGYFCLQQGRYIDKEPHFNPSEFSSRVKDVNLSYLN